MVAQRGETNSDSCPEDEGLVRQGGSIGQGVVAASEGLRVDYGSGIAVATSERPLVDLGTEVRDE